ncbi:MAG: YggT family protein [Actinobacteria bacterium HGW-Actinobacteria-4]|nr:MAG: YggT family protein [Actinobacteria bacterium HGW-Actinobacteria-4]
MELLVSALQFALFIFIVLLIGRMVVNILMSLSADWRPTGAMLVIVEAMLTITDPPIKALRKVVPPLSIGAVRLDLAFMIVFFSCWIAMNVLGTLI